MKDDHKSFNAQGEREIEEPNQSKQQNSLATHKRKGPQGTQPNRQEEPGEQSRIWRLMDWISNNVPAKEMKEYGTH